MSKQQLIDVVDECIGMEYDVPVVPALIAKCALDVIDPNSDSPKLVSYATNLYLREIARRRLARAFDPVESKNTDQVEMFEKLQDMYPAHRPDASGNMEFAYVPRMQLTYEERLFNIDRMQKEISSKQKHVDALSAETATLVDSGFFNNERPQTS
jgi:hypothetical protein